MKGLNGDERPAIGAGDLHQLIEMTLCSLTIAVEADQEAIRLAGPNEISAVNGRGGRVNLNVNILTAHRVRHPERSEGSPSRPDEILRRLRGSG
jgi:hypothetical protein